MGGFNLRAIQQLLGHKDLRMTARYAHLSADHLQQAVNSLDAVLGSSIGTLSEHASQEGRGRESR
jgi:integrase